MHILPNLHKKLRIIIGCWCSNHPDFYSFECILSNLTYPRPINRLEIWSVVEGPVPDLFQVTLESDCLQIGTVLEGGCSDVRVTVWDGYCLQLLSVHECSSSNPHVWVQFDCREFGEIEEGEISDLLHSSFDSDWLDRVSLFFPRRLVRAVWDWSQSNDNQLLPVQYSVHSFPDFSKFLLHNREDLLCCGSLPRILIEHSHNSILEKWICCARKWFELSACFLLLITKREAANEHPVR